MTDIPFCQPGVGQASASARVVDAPTCIRTCSTVGTSQVNSSFILVSAAVVIVLGTCFALFPKSIQHFFEKWLTRIFGGGDSARKFMLSTPREAGIGMILLGIVFLLAY